VAVAAGPALLGAAPAALAADLQRHSDRHALSLNALLDATPPVWVQLPALHVGARLVTNGQYRRFMQAPDPENPDARIADSRALWEYAWHGLGLGIRSRRVPLRDGKRLGSIEESYDGCATFISAYMRSLRRDVERLVSGTSLDARAETAGGGEEGRFRARGQQTMVVSMPSFPLARTAFDALETAMEGGRQPDDPAALGATIGKLIAALEPALRAERDPRRPDARIPMPESLVVLRRAAEACAAGEALVTTRLLYPREWTSPKGPKGLRFPGPRVPWEEQAVVGITLYEAAAYAAWVALSTGRQVGLPNEAEWERVASWPAGGDAGTDPSHKSLWPWWDPSAGADAAARDFTYYFGHPDAGGAEGLYADRREFRRICEETARSCGTAGRVLQLMGFGWQWTVDRFDPRERRYARFKSSRYPTAPPVEGLSEPLYQYRPATDPQNTDFVVRGAPPLVGGAALTTRRFAACPLRASRDIAFRIVVRED